MKRTLSLIPLLLLAAVPVSAQPSIQMGQTVSGSLSGDDPTLDDNSHYDVYTFRATAGQRVRVTLRSDDFDAYLAVGRISGGECQDECETDDDGAGGTDSQVDFTPSTSGVYQIRANSLSEGETGSYRLSLEAGPARREGGGARIRGDVAVGQTVSGELDEGDPTAGDDSYYELWRVRAAPGERLVVTLRSDDFDAYLGWGRMDGGDWDEIESDDDGAGGTDSRIEVTAGDDGTYVIRANSLSEGETGDYRLSVERGSGGSGDRPRRNDDARPTAARPLSIGQPMESSLDENDGTLDDDSHYELWTIRARAGQRLVITLASEDFDTYLAVGRMDGDDFEEIESNDDGEEGTDSEIVFTVPEDGTYVIRANSLGGGETGEYVLTVRAAS